MLDDGAVDGVFVGRGGVRGGGFGDEGLEDGLLGLWMLVVGGEMRRCT